MALETAGIPTLINYFDAKRYHDQVKPLKGNSRNAGRRPLGKNRRYTQCIISEGINGITLSLYGNAVVVYTPDNKIRINAKEYHTHLTTCFLLQVFGRSNLFLGVHKVRGVIHIRDKSGVNYPLPISNTYLTYDVAQDRFVDAAPRIVYRARVRETKRMLRNYASFLDYCKGAIFLIGTEGRWNDREAKEKFNNFYGENADINLDRLLLNSWRMDSYYIMSRAEKARASRTAFFAKLDSAMAHNDHDAIFKRFIDLCIVTNLDVFSYDDMRSTFINLLKLQYPHLLFYRAEVYPTVHIPTKDNEFYVKYCGSKEIQDKLTYSQNV